MPHPNKPMKHGHGGKDSEFLTSNLWVGNLAPNVSDADLLQAFGKYGPVDDVTSYAPRTFGFVYFKHMDSAKVAKEALQGHVIKGNPIRIEFAKPAKPSKHLWVGGISSSVTKEELEEEFLKFGKLEDFKFVRDRNSAFVDYARMEDAAAAVKNLNGKEIGGESIRVDYLRSQSSRRESFEFHDPKDSHFRGMVGPDPSLAFRDPMGIHSETANIGYRNQPSDFGSRYERQPSRILWVGYPPSVIIDEQMLYNAMILFGEIERIKCFPSRHYSFVEFRSVEEAKNAKENLQGKLFNDPRISLMFSSSDMAPKELTAPFQGFPGPREMFASDVPLLPPMVDAYGNNLMDAQNYSSGGVLGPAPARPLGPGGLGRKRLSPTAGVHPSPARNSGLTRNNFQTGWDVHDDDQIPRELKRARTYGFAATKKDDFSGASDHLYSSAHFEGGQVRPLQTSLSRTPIEVRGSGDFIWRGVIAKGGSAVCNARCIPVGKGIDFNLPEVVNCSAKTGLDMLAKHCADAVGFEIVFFLPDSEEDFASYTEFLRFLGSKSRAGVAKFDDGTTMFLVPPSDFLTEVLNVIGPERLYGVVLKLKHQVPPTVSTERQMEMGLPSAHHMDQMPPHLPNDYGNVSSQREHVLQMDHSKFMPDGSVIPPKLPLPPTTSGHSVIQPSRQDSANGIASASQSQLPLTPEMIATLASLLPVNSQSSMTQSGGHPPIPSPSTARLADPTAGQDRSTYSQAWSQHYPPSGQIGPPPHQYDNQLGSQAPPHPGMNFQHYPAISSGNSHLSQNQVFPDNQYNQNPAYYSYLQQGTTSSRPVAVHPDPSQANQYMAAPQTAHQPFQQEVLPQNNVQRGYGPGLDMAPTSMPYGMSSDPQQHRFPGVNSYNPPDNTLSSTGVNSVNLGPANQQPVLAAPGMGSGEVEGDKNQRYQSTLQFAANLLLQIQQQGGSQSGQGTANQQ